MSYIGEPHRFHSFAEAIEKVNQAYAKSNGQLRVQLKNGKQLTGKFYGCHCTANDAQSGPCELCGYLTLADEAADYPSIIDLLDLAAVEGVRPTSGAGDSLPGRSAS